MNEPHCTALVKKKKWLKDSQARGCNVTPSFKVVSDSGIHYYCTFHKNRFAKNSDYIEEVGIKDFICPWCGTPKSLIDDFYEYEIFTCDHCKKKSNYINKNLIRTDLWED